MTLKQKSENQQINDLVRFVKLEAGWILTNLAFTNSEGVKLLIDGTLDDKSALLRTKRKTDLIKSIDSRAQFFNILNKVFENDAHDIVMID